MLSSNAKNSQDPYNRYIQFRMTFVCMFNSPAYPVFQTNHQLTLPQQCLVLSRSRRWSVLDIQIKYLDIYIYHYRYYYCCRYPPDGQTAISPPSQCLAALLTVVLVSAAHCWLLLQRTRRTPPQQFLGGHEGNTCLVTPPGSETSN